MPDDPEFRAPPWIRWHWRDEAARVRRWIERYGRVPTGHGAGAPFKVAAFQRRILTELYGHLAAFVSIPAANGKTTFLAAVALERMCRGDAYAEVDVLATKQEQAGRLVEAAMRMVELQPELARRCVWHADPGILEYRPTGSRIAAHPARLAAVQGLNFSLAIVDEVGFAEDDMIESLIARLGKRPGARVIGIGTPGFEAGILQRLRSADADGDLPPGVTFLEWAAPPGADLHDRKAWRRANPAIAAGFLGPEALEVQAELLPERAFRTYHLGQWVDTSVGWLPPGSWDACPHVDPPPDGAEVVLAVEGTYRRTLAVVGSTMDGSVFHGWAAETGLDSELRAVIDAAAEQYRVIEITHPRRIRPAFFAALAEDGPPVRAWDSSPDNEATSANELYRAITEGRLGHDHDPTVAEHVAHLRVRWGVDGSLRLARPEDVAFVDCAFAARACWWRALQLSESLPVDATPVVY